jgi:chromosome partitioning protein
VAERTAPRAARASSKTASNGTTRDAEVAADSAGPRTPQPARRSRKTVTVPTTAPRIIAVANQKGGVGKSTTAVSLGAALAELGKTVLVVDLDPQGNASTGLGIRHEAREITVYDVLAAEAPIEGAIVPTPLDNLFAIPSTIDLAGAEIELVSQFSRELRLRRALEPLKDSDYDFIFLDCPPSLGLLTVNALAAAEELIVPIQCEYYALEGLGQLLRNVRLVQQNVNHGLRLTGIVMTMFDPRTKLSEQVVAEVRRYFGDRVYRTIIPRTVRLSEAPGFGQPITVYDPRSRGAQSYRDLAREVVDKLPEEGPLPMIEDIPPVAVAPPEPEAVRAPRPLVREEGIEPDLDLASASTNGEPAVRQAPSSDAHVEPEVEPTIAHPEAEAAVEPPTVEAGSSRSEAEIEDAGQPASTAVPPIAHAEAAPAVEPEADAPARREPVTDEAAPGVSEEVEGASTVVIDEQGEEGPGEEPPKPEPEADRAPKRRWSLFRRGGDR